MALMNDKKVQDMYSETRLLLDIKKLCAHYYVSQLYVRQNDDNELVPIPPKRDIYIPLKCYIAYDFATGQWYISQRLQTIRNHWINTLKDDVKNGRIDYHDYC